MRGQFWYGDRYILSSKHTFHITYAKCYELIGQILCLNEKNVSKPEALCLEISLVSRICVKIVLNVVKASRLVQIKLIT